MKKLALILLAIFFISCNKKTELKKELVSEKEIYEVLNTVLIPYEKDNIPLDSNYVSYDQIDVFEMIKHDSLLSVKINSAFSKNDIKFINEQRKNIKKFELKQSLLSNIVVIPMDTINKFLKNNFWSKYYQKYGHRGYNEISLPLFSIDKNVVLMSISYNCGSLCGGGSVWIFKKVNGKWQFYKPITSSAS